MDQKDIKASVDRLLTPQEREICEKLAALVTSDGQRARVMLALDDGATQVEAGFRGGLSPRQVRYWRDKFLEQRLETFSEAALEVANAGLELADEPEKAEPIQIKTVLEVDAEEALERPEPDEEPEPPEPEDVQPEGIQLEEVQPEVGEAEETPETKNDSKEDSKKGKKSKKGSKKGSKKMSKKKGSKKKGSKKGKKEGKAKKKKGKKANK